MLGTFQEFLRDNGKRYTPEREAILNVVLDCEGHFTPEDVAQELDRASTKMSVVTVYRNLPVFVEAGILRRTCLSAGECRYEVVAGREHHDHLICTECGDVTEFQYEAIEVLQQAVAAQYRFTMKRHHLELVGLCEQCRRADEESAGAHQPSEGKYLQ